MWLNEDKYRKLFYIINEGYILMEVCIFWNNNGYLVEDESFNWSLYFLVYFLFYDFFLLW